MQKTKKTMIVEASIIIKGTVTNVWKTITDIRNADKIIGSIEKIEIINEPANGLAGLKWLETRMFFGKPASIEKWITDAVENKFYKTRAEMDDFTFITTYTIAETNDPIRLTSTHETISESFIAKIKSLPMIFFKGMMRKLILQDLNDIKSAVEKG